MKIARTRYDYILLIYVPFALIGIFLSWFFLQKIIITLNYFMPIMLISALGITLTPFARQKPLNLPANSALQPNNWLLKLIALQAGVTLIFLEFSQAIMHFVSENSNIAPALLVQQTLQFYQGGLWPWPFILLVSMAITYLGRAQQKPALLRKSVQPVIKKYADNIIGDGIEIFLKQGLLFVALLTIGSILLQIATTLSQLIALPSLFSFNIRTVLIGSIILVILPRNKLTQVLTRKLYLQQYAEAKIILIFSITTIILLSSLNISIEFFANSFSYQNLINAKLTTISRPTSIQHWLLLSFIWWLGIMPLLSKTIATITQQRSLRELITAGLLLPGLFYLSWHFLLYYCNNLHHFITLYLINSWPLTLALGIISLIITAYLFRNPNTCGITMTTKTVENTHATSVSFLRTLWQSCAFIIAAYFFTNLSFLTLFGAALAAPIFATLISAILGCFLTYKVSSKATL